MERILITGATGLLGSSLVPHLKKCGHKVVTHARTTQADFMFDLSDRVKSYEMLAQIMPSVIINLVSLTNVELCEEQVNLAYLANTSTVESLAYWIGYSGADCHLVQISTDHVYDGTGLHTEDSIALTNNYAFSKYAGELAAVRVPSTILRTNFVGRSQVSHRESLTDWVYNSLRSAKNLQVLSDVYFSPLSITTLSEMIELVVQRRPVGIYNLGSRNGMSKADFDFAFAECLNLETNTMTRIKTCQATFWKAYRPKDMRMDSSKFENVLGVTLPYLNDLIPQLAREYNENA
ncbi:dTDP-4-dehydrorhamnose reductase family protein [Propionivibrio sp.]|uniref:dTDP-4-dehydrorhamnose reductase family protein n=1 Tax=Propionivibrio sp. TaxID=2212460 RepID=UPI003BF1F7EB